MYFAKNFANIIFPFSSWLSFQRLFRLLWGYDKSIRTNGSPPTNQRTYLRNIVSNRSTHLHNSTRLNCRIHSIEYINVEVWPGSSVCVLVTTVSLAKTAEPIEMPFGGQTHVGSGNRELDGVYIGATWRIRYINLCGGVDAACRCHYCSKLI